MVNLLSRVFYCISSFLPKRNEKYDAETESQKRYIKTRLFSNTQRDALKRGHYSHSMEKLINSPNGEEKLQILIRDGEIF